MADKQALVDALQPYLDKERTAELIQVMNDFHREMEINTSLHEEMELIWRAWQREMYFKRRAERDNAALQQQNHRLIAKIKHYREVIRRLDKSGEEITKCLDFDFENATTEED